VIVTVTRDCKTRLHRINVPVIAGTIQISPPRRYRLSFVVSRHCLKRFLAGAKRTSTGDTPMLSRTVSFANFNLYNLNEPGLPMYRNSAGWTADAVARKVAWSSAMLRRARADVFGFQELWHRDTL